MKHTQGKWWYSHGEIIAMPQQMKVAQIYPVGIISETSEETEANGRLIESAPELLNTLERVSDELGSKPEFNKLNELVRNTIEKVYK